MRTCAWMRAAATVGLLCSMALAVAAAAQAGEKSPAGSAATLDEDFPRATLPDAISGKDLALIDGRGEQATVLICMSTECPISDEFMPTIVEIAATYRERGVKFIGINPNGGQTLDEMASYARDAKVPFPFLKDAGGKVARTLLFSVTPEARVFDRSGKLVYSGRIDDRYRRGGATDPNVSRDLKKALDEVLADKPVSASKTKPVGCPLQIGEPQGH